MRVLTIVLPMLLLSFIFSMVIVGVVIYRIRQKVKKNNQNLLLVLENLTRNREFDAFVCYNFEENNEYVISDIHQNWKRKPNPFRLLLESRDFNPGDNIIGNIEYAIKKQ